MSNNGGSASTRPGNLSNALCIAAAVGVGALAAVRLFVRQQRRVDFHGKTVLITGGSRGLGLILARLFAREGAKVAICARDEAELSRARIDLLQNGVPEANVFAIQCDVQDTAQIAGTVDAVVRQFGPIDILVNNAGVIQVGPMETMTRADYEEALRVHFWAPYHFVHAVLPGMRARRAGRIANIASIGGLISPPHLLPYSTSKSALVGFSEGLRAELTKNGILVTTVCPGLMRTGSPTNAYFKGQHDREYTWFALSDSLPGASQSADHAAREIVDAVRHGDPFLVTSMAAKAGAFLHGVFPGLTDDLLALTDLMLPSMPPGGSTERHTGQESETALTRSPLTALTRQAERENNQRPAPTATALE